MTSRTPLDHSYVPYTGRPYIYYNGVSISRQPIDQYPEYDNAYRVDRPIRTVCHSKMNVTHPSQPGPQALMAKSSGKTGWFGLW